MKEKNTTSSTSLSFRALLLCVLPLFIFQAGCNNSRLRALLGGDSNNTTSTTTSTDSYKISSVTITANGSATTTTATVPYVTRIFFDTSQSTNVISNHCQLTTTNSPSTKPCSCVYTWQEVNTQSGSSVTIPRTVRTDVDLVQPNVAGCKAPDVFQNEILDGTTLKITIVPQKGNPDTFSVSTYTYVKNQSTNGSNASGSFQDAQGRAFINVLRYTCYDTRKRGMTIQSKMGPPQTNQNSGEAISSPLASGFCVAKANGGGLAAEGCQGLPAPDYSAQSYYYNLFIRENEAGDINPGNGRYICPQVRESLNSNGSIGTQGQYWPLDSTFALSMGKTPDFPIGVVSNSKTSNPGDNTSNSTDCDGAAATGGTTQATDSLSHSCLGFAARPNSDGTCPYLKDASGILKPTYRLRKYFTLYPPVFDTDGKALSEPQAVDTIYVLDRPVNASTNPDPLKPYTMLGPKPCPFAYFDNKSVLASRPSYSSTNDSRWTGTNVDGIQFPNYDAPPTADTPASCSAALPILSTDKTTFTLGTVNALNKAPASHGIGTMKNVYVRPIIAWSPHYEEDTSFMACAPLSTNFRDPPLHFAKNQNTGNVAWCAEIYPTQNDNIPKLDIHDFAFQASYGVGNGVISNISGGTSATNETITIVFTGALTFTVTSSVPGATITPSATGNVGVPFASNRINFTITAGGTAFQAGDAFFLKNGVTSPALGIVRPFTSHVVKNSSSTACVAKPNNLTTKPSNYPLLGLANHISGDLIDRIKTAGATLNATQTCDRTVITPANGIAWPRFPLLAPAGGLYSGLNGVEEALANTADTSYSCMISFDGSSGKTGKFTPSQGCCGANVKVTTGLPTSGTTFDTAHLEPDAPCLTPNY